MYGLNYPNSYNFIYTNTFVLRSMVLALDTEFKKTVKETWFLGSVFPQLLLSSKWTKRLKALLTYYLSSNSIIIIWPKFAQIQSLIYRTTTTKYKSYNILLLLKCRLKYHQNKIHPSIKYLRLQDMGGANGSRQGKKIKDLKTSSSVIPKQKKRLKYVFFPHYTKLHQLTEVYIMLV